MAHLNAKGADGHNNLAWFLTTCPEAKFRDAAKALPLAKKAVELEPRSWAYWNTLGVAYYRAGHWQLTVSSLERTIELHQQGGTAFDFFFLAMAHWKLDQKETARKLYDQAVQWMEKNAAQNEELRRFRAEAEQLLGIGKKES